METKAKRQTAMGLPLCKRKIAGAIPAESTLVFLSTKCVSPPLGFILAVCLL